MNKHKHILFTFFVFAFLVALSSCSRKTDRNTAQAWQYNDKNITDSINAGYIPATVIRLSLDGCSWMIKLEDEKKLEPDNLQPAFRKENLKVWIRYAPRKGVSACMAGEPVTITEIQLRK